MMTIKQQKKEHKHTAQKTVCYNCPKKTSSF